MLTRLAIIADDLTGALDSAAPFARRGLRTMVFPRPDDVPDAWPEGISLVAVSTGSRELPEAEAEARTRDAAQRLRRLAPQIAFKKVDSRLKGHVAREIAACAEVFDLAEAIIAPAIPAFGRVVEGGVLTGAGIDGQIEVLTRTGGFGQVPNVVADADFAPLVEAILSRPVLAVGARGLAEALAERLAPGIAPLPAIERPACFVIGSVDPITRKQLDVLRDHLQHSGAGADDVSILATPDRSGPLSTQLSRDFARDVAAGIRRHGPRTVIVTGGETAAHLLDVLGVRELAVEGEALPGIPQTVVTVDGTRLRLLTKSGGFGTQDTLRNLYDGMERRHGGDA